MFIIMLMDDTLISDDSDVHRDLLGMHGVGHELNAGLQCIARN